jgi:hypothetical protein
MGVASNKKDPSMALNAKSSGFLVAGTKHVDHVVALVC